MSTEKPDTRPLDDCSAALDDEALDGIVGGGARRTTNFQIQDLMSRYNQSQALSSSVAKKLSDTDNTVINKI